MGEQKTEHGWLNPQIDLLTLSYSTKFGGSTSQQGEYAQGTQDIPDRWAFFMYPVSQKPDP